MVADSKSKQAVPQMVLEVELVTKESMYGFHENKKAPFLKVNMFYCLISKTAVYFNKLLCFQITVALPRFIAAAKRLLEKGEIDPPFNNYCYQAYESNIDFEIRLDVFTVFFQHAFLLIVIN